MIIYLFRYYVELIFLLQRENSVKHIISDYCKGHWMSVRLSPCRQSDQFAKMSFCKLVFLNSLYLGLSFCFRRWCCSGWPSLPVWGRPGLPEGPALTCHPCMYLSTTWNCYHAATVPAAVSRWVQHHVSFLIRIPILIYSRSRPYISPLFL